MTTRNFYVNGEKSERVKIVKKKGNQFIIIHAIVQRKASTFFWDNLYMENFVIFPDKARELKLLDIKDFEKVDFDNVKPVKVTAIDYEEFDLTKIIYDTVTNYQDREIVRNNFGVYADMITEWDKELDKTIKDFKEVELNIEEADEEKEDGDLIDSPSK